MLLILRCPAMDPPHCCSPQPSKAPGPGQALRQLVPAWPGPATRSAGPGRHREARKARWAAEGIVMARKLNCSIVQIQGGDFFYFLTGHSRRCLFLVEFKPVLQDKQERAGPEGCSHLPLTSRADAVASPGPCFPGFVQHVLATPGSQAATPREMGLNIDVILAENFK